MQHHTSGHHTDALASHRWRVGFRGVNASFQRGPAVGLSTRERFDVFLHILRPWGRCFRNKLVSTGARPVGH